MLLSFALLAGIAHEWQDLTGTKRDHFWLPLLDHTHDHHQQCQTLNNLWHPLAPWLRLSDLKHDGCRNSAGPQSPLFHRYHLNISYVPLPRKSTSSQSLNFQQWGNALSPKFLVPSSQCISKLSEVRVVIPSEHSSLRIWGYLCTQMNKDAI